MTNAAALDRAIEDASPSMIRLAEELIAIPTENPPGKAYAECVELLHQRLTGLGLEVDLVDLGQAKTAVVGGFGTGLTLHFHGHYDVVPASSANQFDPVVHDGRLVGRGSADMKGAVASMAFAVAALSAFEIPGRVELVVVPDEETGGSAGAQRLLEFGRLGRNGVAAILGEPTSGAIWNAHRGAITLRIKVTGQPAHVGLHYQGLNAFECAIPIINRLWELKREVEQRRTSFRTERAEESSSILMMGGEVAGGHQFNVVPASFSFTVERRFNPEENLEEERDRLRRTIRDATPPLANVEVVTIQGGNASGVSEDADLVKCLRRAVEEVDGKTTSCALCPGLLESRFYEEAGVPAVAYGPGELEVSHGPNESVEIGRLIACSKIYARFALRLLSAYRS
ncbi:MAG: ArgE/DapE family deacylase [Gemmatimonadota bacterium]